jgi:hypothetical protein
MPLSLPAVVLRESGGPSTPRLLDSIIGASGILGRPVKPGDDDGGFRGNRAPKRADVNETSLDNGQRVHHFLVGPL